MSHDWNNIHILYYIIYYSLLQRPGPSSSFISQYTWLLSLYSRYYRLFLCRQAGGSVVSRTQDTMVSTEFDTKPFPIRHSPLKLCYTDVLLATSPQLYHASISLPLQHYMHSLSSLSIHLCIYVSTPLHDFLHLCHPLRVKHSSLTHIL